MANDGFPTEKLGSLCSKVGSGATPRGGSKVYLDKGEIALIRSQNVYNDGFNREGLVYITAEHAEQLSNVTVEPEDVLLNITGDSVARCCQVDPRVLPARVNQHVSIIRPKPDELIPRFLHYFLVSPTMQAQMLSWAHAGATRKALTKGMIESFKVPKPDLTIQQRIAYILGTLDDKIELNRRMNRTLEKMAAAIFKSWFVDFDPVRAKADLPAAQDTAQAGGQDTGLPKEIADLFPDSFEDSEVGPIPKGWIFKKLGDIADVSWGDTNVTKKSYSSAGYTAYSAKGPDGFLPYYDFDRVGVVVSAIGANSGHTWFACDKWSCIKNTIRFWATDCNISTEYLFFATHGEKIWPLRGSAQPFISQTDARNLRVLYPAKGLAKTFGQIAEIFFTKIEANDKQNRSLARLRDTLLSKLLSGGIELPVVETITEEMGA